MQLFVSIITIWSINISIMFLKRAVSSKQYNKKKSGIFIADSEQVFRKRVSIKRIEINRSNN